MKDYDQIVNQIQEFLIKRTRAQKDGLWKTVKMHDRQIAELQREAIEIKPIY